MGTKPLRSKYLPRYEVIVGNVGTVYSGDDTGRAYKTYWEYVSLSKTGHGRAGAEGVSLLVDNEPVHEYFPVFGENADEYTEFSSCFPCG